MRQMIPSWEELRAHAGHLAMCRGLLQMLTALAPTPRPAARAHIQRDSAMGDMNLKSGCRDMYLQCVYQPRLATNQNIRYKKAQAVRAQHESMLRGTPPSALIHRHH